MKASVLQLIIFFLLPLVGSLAVAKEIPTYVIGVENIDYRPFYHTNSGNYQGFARELFDHFAKTSGIRFHYAPMPIPRLYRSLIIEKDIDFKFPDHPQWGRDFKKSTNLHYSHPVISYTDGMLTPVKNQEVQKFCTVTGFTMLGYDELLLKQKLIRRDLHSFEDALRILKKGDIDGIYGNFHVMKFLSKKNKMEELQLNINYPMSVSEYYLSTTKHPSILKDFAEYLDKNKDFVILLKKKYHL